MASIQLPIDHFQQRQKGECLAACAVMALTYLGLAADYNRLLKLLEVEPEVGAIFSPAFPNAPLQVSHGDFGLAWLERDEFYAALSRRA